MSGSYELESPTDKPTEGLFEGKLVVDKTYGYAVHGCASCCPEYDSRSIVNDPLNLVVGESSYQHVSAYNACTDTFVQLSASNWATGNSLVATATTADATRGLVTGAGVGSTTDSADVKSFALDPRGYCRWYTVKTTGAVNVAQKIDHMMVIVDTSGVCSGCTTTVARFIKYQIQNVQNQNIGAIQIAEQTGTNSNSCANGNPITTTCSQLVFTDSISQFVDEWSINTDHVTPPSCGYTVYFDTWQWCKPLGGTENAGTLSGYIHANSILENGVYSPNKIPQGTIIYP